MGVYVIGMEMPKSCYKCPLRRRNGMDIVCPVAHERFSVADINILNYRLDNCPLVEIPPHGDLIDRREAIIDANERAYDFWLSDDEVNASIQFLKEQPAIISADPAEEGER